VPLPQTVPVVLFYATALTDRQGRALFSEDIYGLDEKLLRALRAD
jgi:murein L,D-transpeptidase YcbB/YkuD